MKNRTGQKKRGSRYQGPTQVRAKDIVSLEARGQREPWAREVTEQQRQPVSIWPGCRSLSISCREPRSQSRSGWAEQGLSKQAQRDGKADRSREPSSQWSSCCRFPGTGEGSPYWGRGSIRITGLEGLPACKWILSSPQGLPRVIKLCLIFFRSPHLGNQHLPKPSADLWLFPTPASRICLSCRAMAGDTWQEPSSVLFIGFKQFW